jgi:peroxiredoxin
MLVRSGVYILYQACCLFLLGEPMSNRTITTNIVAALAAGLFLICPVSAEQQAMKIPTFSLQSPAGETVHLPTYIGKKPVLLVFWATWCPFCRTAVPRLNRIDAAGKVQIIAINVEESRSKVTSFITKNNITYPVVLDPDGKTANAYHVPGVPAYVVVNTAGRIVYRGESFPESISEDANNSMQ